MKRWLTLPGATRGARCAWAWHLVAALALAAYVLGRQTSGKKLKKLAEASSHVAGGDARLSDFIEVGLWRGSLVALAVCALVLLTVRWWGRAQGCGLAVRLPAAQASQRWFWPLLLLICVAAGTLRWPRMGMSYWGDEGWAARYYGYGVFRSANEGKSVADLQAGLKFDAASWTDALFRDYTGGNHFLFTLSQQAVLRGWRGVKGLPDYAFDEAVSRLPPFLAGMGSIPALALLLRWLGRPRAGLLAAAFFAIHPWHLRYSTEARGYSMMLCFCILALWALLKALESGRWRWWGAAGAGAFATVYSWKLGALYYGPAVGVCMVWVLRSELGWADRWATLGRLLVSMASAGALFVLLFYPAMLQSPEAIARLQHTGKPMEHQWLHDSLSLAATGAPWDRQDAQNRTEVPLAERLLSHPVSSRIGLLGDICFMGLGWLLLLKGRPALAWSCLGMLLAGAGGAALFKWGIRIEWITWYFLPLILPLVLLKAVGLDDLISIASARVRRLGGPLRMRVLGFGSALLALLVPMASAYNALPQISLMLSQPYESQREAFTMTRGKHEPWGYAGQSKVWTVYLWRHIYLYDPRADLYCRDVQALRARMAEVDAADGELYVVVGQRALVDFLSPGLLPLLRDEKVFEPLGLLWAEEAIHTLEVFRYRRASPAL